MTPGPVEAVPSLEEIAREWTGRLQRYAASILRDGEMARDAVQDVLLKLCGRSAEDANGHHSGFLGFPTDEPAIRAWLFKAVRNRCIDLLRKEGRMSLLEDHSQPLDAHPARLRLAGGDTNHDDPAWAADQHEQASAALAALDRLPALQREALRLKFSGELSYKQIADAMGKSVSHVGVLIHEGLKSLRQQLA